MRPMRAVLRVLTMSCEGATAVVSQSLDGRPARSEQVALRLHLICCPGCRRFDRQMRFLRRVMSRLKARLEGEDAAQTLVLPPDVRERIRLALENAAKAPSPEGIVDHRSID